LRQTPSATQRHELYIGIACLLLSALMAWGAWPIPSEAGYQGVGPNFLPWVVAVALLICGVLLTAFALRGGWADRDAPEGAAHGDWKAFAIISSALLINALLITRLGFILSCALCFVIALRGFHLSQGHAWPTAAQWLRDVFIGLALCAPVYWLFTQVLGISLPGLTATGWI
jgi:putative tricarboxylic transport membrane protein